MPVSSSIVKKWPFILTVKAFVFFFLILCTFTFAHKVSAATYSNLQFVLTGTSWSLDISNYSASGATGYTRAVCQGTYPTCIGSAVAAGSGGVGNGTFYTAPIALFDTSQIASFPAGIYFAYLTETNGAHNTYVGAFQWDGATIHTQIDTSSRTRIFLNDPADNATTTSPVALSAVYYINLASSTLRNIPSAVRFDVTSVQGGLLSGSNVLSGTKSYTQQVNFADLSFDALSFATKTFTLPEGVYTWSASFTSNVAGTQTTDQPCGMDAFCYYFGHGGNGLALDVPVTASTTLMTTETRTFVVGAGGLFSGQGSTSTATTTNTLTFCRNYDGGNYIVTAICFIPNTLATLFNSLVFADPVTVANDYASIKGDIQNVGKLFPWGYATRFYSILTATSTATSTLPTYTVVFQTAASTTESLTFDPGDMLVGGGTLLASVHDPINNKTARDVFEPMVQLSVALAVIFTIIADLTGSHKHHSMDIKQTNKKLS